MLDEQVADIQNPKIPRNGNHFFDQTKWKYQSLIGSFDLIPNQCDHIIRTLYQKFNIFLAYMENYTATHANAEQIKKVYDELRLIGACHKVSYPTIKKWFCETHFEIIQFGIEGAA